MFFIFYIENDILCRCLEKTLPILIQDQNLNLNFLFFNQIQRTLRKGFFCILGVKLDLLKNFYFKKYLNNKKKCLIFSWYYNH